MRHPRPPSLVTAPAASPVAGQRVKSTYWLNSYDLTQCHHTTIHRASHLVYTPGSSHHLSFEDVQPTTTTSTAAAAAHSVFFLTPPSNYILSNLSLRTPRSPPSILRTTTPPAALSPLHTSTGLQAPPPPPARWENHDVELIQVRVCGILFGTHAADAVSAGTISAMVHK